jgi:hypothetical protein
MGGVSAKLAEGDVFSCATAAKVNNDARKQDAATKQVFFMRMFYQNQLEDGTEMRKAG